MPRKNRRPRRHVGNLRPRGKPISPQAVRLRAHNQLVRDCCQYLELRKTPHSITDSGAKLSPTGFRRKALGTAGWPDVSCVLSPNGRFLGVEVKTGNAVLNPAQRQIKGLVEASGGLWLTVHSLSDLIAAMNCNKILVEALGG